MDWVTGIHRAIRYVEEHLREELTIQKIAQQAAVSPFYFQKGFAILCGMTDYSGPYLGGVSLYRPDAPGASGAEPADFFAMAAHESRLQDRRRHQCGTVQRRQQVRKRHPGPGLLLRDLDSRGEKVKRCGGRHAQDRAGHGADDSIGGPLYAELVV